MKIKDMNLIQYRMSLETWLQKLHPNIWDYWETEASHLLEV